MASLVVGEISPLMTDPGGGGGGPYTSLKKPGGWSGYDAHQTLSVQLSSAGSFQWGNVIQPTLRATISGTVTATGDVYKNATRQAGCHYSKVGAPPDYTFHSSCPKSFKVGDIIWLDLHYSFTCYGNRPCSLDVWKSFKVS